ncbi:hypothetical protein, partial [Roseospira navarrensis]|uniref:hypothetical protein n=1 Tax=Roseospira navarrensis TaxID=140058 RepID=UPI001FEA08B7
MVLDRALADAKSGGDHLAGLPREDKGQDLVLPGRQAGNAAGRAFMPGFGLSRRPRPLQRTANAGERRLGAHRLLKKAQFALDMHAGCLGEISPAMHARIAR